MRAFLSFPCRSLADPRGSRGPLRLSSIFREPRLPRKARTYSVRRELQGKRRQLQIPAAQASATRHEFGVKAAGGVAAKRRAAGLVKGKEADLEPLPEMPAAGVLNHTLRKTT